MKFASLVFFAAFAVAVDTIDVGVKSLEESINSFQGTNIRHKRTLGVTKDKKQEIEITKKDGSSIKISRSTSYNDGGALTGLPAVMDSAANNRLRLLNQLQNGKGRPELTNSMINPPSSDTGSFDDVAGGSDVSTNIDPNQTTGSASVNEDFGHRPSTGVAGISEGGGSVIDSGAGGSHIGRRPIHIGNGSTHVSVNGDGPVVIGGPTIVNGESTVAIAPVVSRPDVVSPIVSRRVVVSPVVSSPVVVNPVVSRPIVVTPLISKPVVVNPIITGEVCCGQSKPITTVPVTLVAVNTGHSHIHNLLKKKLQKSVEYHNRKQAFKQHLLDKLAAKEQTSVVALVPVQPVHVHTPECGHLIPVVPHQSKLSGLKELIAYKHEVKAQKHLNKVAAIHAKLAQKQYYRLKCPTCCCD